MTSAVGDADRVPDVATVDELQDALGVRLDDTALLRRALVHRSWSFEHGHVPTNERLEFLGDAVLSLAVAQRLLVLLPDEDEGRLARLRAHLVSEPELADVARGLGLGPHLLLGRGEAASGGADKDSLLSDALEAVLGAVHTTCGWDVADALVLRLVGPRLEELLEDGLVLDHKTALQEWLVAAGRGTPAYTSQAEGPDHAQRFTVHVADGQGIGLASGTGSSKKRAEKAAARAAWRSLRARVDDTHR